MIPWTVYELVFDYMMSHDPYKFTDWCNWIEANEPRLRWDVQRY